MKKVFLLLSVLITIGCGSTDQEKIGYDPAAPHRVLMFYSDSNAQCRKDWLKIYWSGNAHKFRRIDIQRHRADVAFFNVKSVPTYIIQERRDEWVELFRTHDLRELDRVTRNHR